MFEWKRRSPCFGEDATGGIPKSYSDMKELESMAAYPDQFQSCWENGGVLESCLEEEVGEEAEEEEAEEEAEEERECLHHERSVSREFTCFCNKEVALLPSTVM